jgi:molybdopterin molybdotransferase
MPEFITLAPPLEALSTFLNRVDTRVEIEEVDTTSALGRVNVDPIIAGYPLPSFRRSTVDGYAVQAGSTHGASDTLPAYLELVGEIHMGTVPNFSVKPGQCGLIHTGGMLPDGTDAVVMVEYTQRSQPEEIEIFKSVAVGENVLQVGEDVKEGEEVIPSGVKIRPAEIGGLMALGITKIVVYKKPHVGIISSGDEVVPPWEEMKPGQVRDINTYSLSALVEQYGAEARSYGIIHDEFDDLLEVASRALEECDLVVITAGSSASARDITADVINALGEPGVLVHGVNVRPGKPTILGICNRKPVIGLPGNPVSALVIAGIFILPLIDQVIGINNPRPKAALKARLSINLATRSGREDWIPVKLQAREEGLIADPIFGKSNLIFILSRADGLIRVPPDTTGLGVGEEVEVFLF